MFSLEGYHTKLHKEAQRFTKFNRNGRKDLRKERQEALLTCNYHLFVIWCLVFGILKKVNRKVHKQYRSLPQHSEH